MAICGDCGLTLPENVWACPYGDSCPNCRSSNPFAHGGNPIAPVIDPFFALGRDIINGGKSEMGNNDSSKAASDYDPLIERVSEPGRTPPAEGAGSDPLVSGDTAASPIQKERESLMHAYHGTFSEDKALEDLWKRAAAEAETFPEVRAAFWELVNNDSSSEAKRVRAILDAAGFALMGGNCAPRLRVEEYDLVRAEDEGRRRTDLTLTIDHIVAQSDKDRGAALTLDADNLRFMLSRDNSFRGTNFDEHDRRVLAAHHLRRVAEGLDLKWAPVVPHIAEELYEHFRREYLEREGRQRENAATDNAREWAFWNDPINGFWARMRKQDEASQWLSELTAKQLEDFVTRMRELAEGGAWTGSSERRSAEQEAFRERVQDLLDDHGLRLRHKRTE